MAKKQELSPELKDLKAKVQEKVAIIGLERTLKGLRAKTLAKVFLAANAPQKARDDLMHYASLANVPVVTLALDNEELGIFCKKNFLVAVVGVPQE